MIEKDSSMDMNVKLVKFFKEIEPYVVTFYASQRDVFKSISWDYKDLKQEILIVLWKRILSMKEKSDVEQIKYIKKSIKDILINFYRKAKANRQVKFDSSPMEENSFIVENINDDFVYEGIKSHLNSDEYKVIYALYHDNMPMNDETAIALGYQFKQSLTYYKESAIEKLSKVGLESRQNTTYRKRKR